jgi:hypothetical protein
VRAARLRACPRDGDEAFHREAGGLVVSLNVKLRNLTLGNGLSLPAARG